MTRVLVCGGRDYTDAARLEAVLDEIDAELGPLIIIEGEARGADQLAALWASHKGRECIPFPANWDRHGLRAGPIRNQTMLDHGRPDIVVAFPGGRGTADMVARARRARLEVREVS